MFINTTSLNKIINEFINFAYTNKILTFFIGSFMGLSTSNLILSFRKNILDYILTKLFNLGTINTLFFLTSIIEFSLMLTLLYFIIRLIKPYFDEKDKEGAIASQSQQDKLINILNRIDKRLEASEAPSSTSAK
jgi:large-conductance mechanosensitive channel